MQKVICCRGLPASGKSSWAKKLIDDNLGQYKIVNNDSLRSMLDNGKWSGGNEKFMGRIRDFIIKETILSGKNLVIDNTHLNPKAMDSVKRLVLEYAESIGRNVEVEVKDFTDVPLEECIARDAKRENGVGRGVIMDMYNRYLKPNPPTEVPGAPRAIIVDIDGTLAIHQGRSPYEWARVGEDKLNESVARVAASIIREGEIDVLIVSGRDAICRGETEKWLRENGVEYNHLFMRPVGDNRKDTIIKKEIYDGEIKGRYNVLFVLDDRNVVVDQWRSLGLQCFQVADGNF